MQNPEKLRLLIVDDNQAARDTMAALLEDFYEVDVVKNGEEALVRLRGWTVFDAVCTDFDMGAGMNGIELLRLVPPQLGRILVTGYPERLEPGCFVLVKPYPLEALLYTVRAAIASAQKKRSGAWKV